MNILKSNIFYFFVFFAINLVLKLIFAADQPFSYDEIISSGISQKDFGHIKHDAEWDNNPPFYYYCLWVWVKIFPLNEFYTRLLSVLFVSVAIGFNFILIRKNLNLFTAIITCTFLTLSNIITFYAHDSRTYSLILLLGVTSSLLFFKFLNKPNNLNLFWLALINFLIIYSHYIAALIIVGQYIFILIFEKKQYLKIFLFQSLFILSLVFIRFTKKQFLLIFNFNNAGDFWLKPATFSDFTNALNQLFFSSPTFIIYIIISIIAFIIYYKKVNSDTKKFLFYCLLLGHFSILFLYTLGTFKAVFLDRYLIFTIPFLITFTVFSVSKLNKVGYVIASLIIIFPLITINLNPIKGMDYKPVAEIIKKKYTNQSCILINKNDNVNLFYYYYDYTNFIKYQKHDSLFLVNRIFGANDTNQLKALNLDRYNTIYLVQSFNQKVNGKDIVRDYLAHTYTQKSYTNKYNATEFSIYQK